MNHRALTICAIAFVGSTLTFFVSQIFVDEHMLGPVDDAYISARYAENFAHGNGLSFNPGERVEGFTNPLLVFIESVVVHLGGSPVVAMNVVGRSFLVLLGALTSILFYFWVLPQSALISVVLGAFLTLNPALICWSASGMESGVFVLFLLAGIAVAASTRRALHALISACLILLSVLTRPEGLVFFPVSLGAIHYRGHNHRWTLLHAAVFLLGFAFFFTWRALYFGEFLPLTFYAKLDYGSLSLARRGLSYVGDFTRSYPVLLVGAAIAAARCGRKDRTVQYGVQPSFYLGIPTWEPCWRMPMTCTLMRRILLLRCWMQETVSFAFVPPSQP